MDKEWYILTPEEDHEQWSRAGKWTLAFIVFVVLPILLLWVNSYLHPH